MKEHRRLDPASLRLVAITDSLGDGMDGLVARAASVVRGGATMVQLRLKDESPRTLVEVARRLRLAIPDVPLLVNDRADVALAAGAQGVHLGVEDVPAGALRRVVPEWFVIGASAGDAEQLRALADADYVAVGPVFARAGTTALGLDGLGEMAAVASVPVLAIGGITAGNAAAVIEAGASGVALISELLRVADPMQRARAFRDALDATER